jgi:acid phosphatase family membrane protein YuiD
MNHGKVKEQVGRKKKKVLAGCPVGISISLSQSKG